MKFSFLKFGDEFDALNFIANSGGIKFMLFCLPKGASERDGVRLLVDTKSEQIFKKCHAKVI